MHDPPHGSLDALRADGVEALDFWCVGSRRACRNRRTVALDELIEEFGGKTCLITLARRATCRACGRRGAHVQPAEPPLPDRVGWNEWAARQRRLLTERLVRLDPRMMKREARSVRS
jgi:hypothetical protein